ncbi:MAG: porin [Planctomycetota bacterium]|jgi:phosphate-selective porin OprO/OprP
MTAHIRTIGRLFGASANRRVARSHDPPSYRPIAIARAGFALVCAGLGLVGASGNCWGAEPTIAENEAVILDPPEHAGWSDELSTEPTPRTVAPRRRAEDKALRGVFDDGFGLESWDGEHSLRFHLLAQTDFKVFDPTDQDPAARTGMYIPRARVYFEGQFTEPYEYELSLQRSLEGQFDLLDANFNVRWCEERLQVTVGRFLVPYSYAWYDHLEQYFLVPERGLFPLNFGLSRSTGGMIWGSLGGGRLQYAVAGITGRQAGLADNSDTAEGVAYLNVRPFLKST